MLIAVGAVAVVQTVALCVQGNKISALETKNKNWSEQFDTEVKKIRDESQKAIDAMKAEKQELISKNDSLIKANQELSKKNEESIRESQEARKKNEELSKKVEASQLEMQKSTRESQELARRNQELSKKVEASQSKMDESIKESQEARRAMQEVTAQLAELLRIPGVQASVEIWKEAGDMYRSNLSEPHSEPSTIKSSEEGESCTKTVSMTDSMAGSESDIEIIDPIYPNTSMNGLKLSCSMSNQRQAN